MDTTQIPFYDSYAVSVYNEQVISRGGMQCDYVGIGRVMSECHGLRYIPHAVITGKQIVNNGYCSYNTNLQQAKPQAATSLQTQQLQQQQLQQWKQQQRDANVFAAGDTVQIDFDYLMNCKGILIGLTRYTNPQQSTQTLHNGKQDYKQSKVKSESQQVEQEYERNEQSIYYLVRKPNSKEPLCLIPLHHHTNTLPTILALQLHPLHFTSGQTLWEVSALQECIAPCDVKHVVLALQTIAHDLFTLYETTLNDELRIITKSTKLCQSQDHNRQISNREHCCVVNGKTIQIVMGNDLQQNVENTTTTTNNNKGVKPQQQQQQKQQNNGVVKNYDQYTNNSYSQLTPQQKELYVQLKTQYNSQFVELLANVPIVTRTGRQQYNVGQACRGSNEMIQERIHNPISKQLRKRIENNNNSNDSNNINKINNANRIRTKSFNIIDNEDSVLNDSDTDQVNIDDEDANVIISNNNNNNNINNNNNNNSDIAHNNKEQEVDDDEEEEESDHSLHNEILEEALRVAVPQYTRNTLVRYDNKAYNYGGDYHALAEHLVKHRASYAYQLAEQQNKQASVTNNNNIISFLFAPHGLFASSCQQLLTLQRMSALQNDNIDEINRRPPLPPQFVTRKASTHETTMQKKRNSLAGRRKHKGKHSSKGKKKSKHRGKSASLRRKSKGKKRSKSKSMSMKKPEKSKSLDGGGSSSRKRSSVKVKEGSSKSHVDSNTDYNERKTSKKQTARRKASHSPTRVVNVV